MEILHLLHGAKFPWYRLAFQRVGYHAQLVPSYVGRAEVLDGCETIVETYGPDYLLNLVAALRRYDGIDADAFLAHKGGQVTHHGGRSDIAFSGYLGRGHSLVEESESDLRSLFLLWF